MGETVTGKGVPVQLSGTSYENDYGASIVLIRSMREGDEKMPVADLVKNPPTGNRKRSSHMDGDNVVASESGCSIIPVIESCDSRIVSADRTFRIPLDLDAPELCLQPVEDEEPLFQHVPYAHDELDHFKGLKRSDHAGDSANKAGRLERIDNVGRRHLLKQTAITMPFTR